MKINDIDFSCSLEDILNELVRQLRLNNIPYIQKMRPTHSDIQISCPYHKGGLERRPSAGVRRSDGLFHCLACGETHSIQEVIGHCFGEDEVAASFGWRWLLKNFATIEVEERQDVELDLERNQDNRKYRSAGNSNSDGNLCIDDIDSSDKKYVGRDELESYRYYHSYWTKRGITDENIIELFDLGYDPKTKCITFPVRDQKGNCLFVARRSVHTKYFNYPAGSEKPLYGLYEIYQVTHNIEDIIVCESMIDALTAWQYGRYAVALNGLGSESQFEDLRKLPCRHLILATDNDDAGMQARERIRKKVTNKIITEYILPDGKKDLNDLSKEEFLNLEEVF